MFYNARYYSPYLNRWLQPDVIVPDGEKASIIPLTVSYHELPLLAQLNAENAFTLRHGHWPQLSAAEKREAKINRGPLNPQQLNRYSYVLNNPLKLTDPDGHEAICTTDYRYCSGGRVINNSSSPILVRGEQLRADGTTVRIIIRLDQGETSTDFGLIDVDEILPYTDRDGVDYSINGKTGDVQFTVRDGETITVVDDGGKAVLSGGSELTGHILRANPRKYEWGDRFARPVGNYADISGTKFVNPWDFERHGRLGPRYPGAVDCFVENGKGVCSIK